jgi:hypothetical protein
MKIMFTKFCQIFASGIKSESLDWGNEIKNLPPGFASILNEHEALSGPGYDEYLHTVVDDYFSACQVSISDISPLPCILISAISGVLDSQVARYARGLHGATTSCSP